MAITPVNEAVFPWQLFIVINIVAVMFMIMAWHYKSALLAWFSTFFFLLDAHMAPITVWDVGGSLYLFPAMTLIEIIFISIAVVNGVAGMVFFLGGDEYG